MTDTAVAHGPIQAYKNAIQKLEDLAGDPGHPNENAWFNQVRGHTNQASNTMRRLVEQGHQFRIEPKENGVKLEIKKPANAEPAGYGPGGRVGTPANFLILYGVLGIMGWGAGMQLIASTTSTSGGALAGGLLSSTGGQIPATTPTPSDKVNVWGYSTSSTWRRAYECYSGHMYADVVGDQTNVDEVEDAIEDYLEQYGTCPKSVNQLEDHIESTVEFVDDFSTSPGVTFSFEEGSPSSPPANPWYVFNNAGFHNVSTDRVNHGSQSLHMGGAEVRDPSAVAVDLDLSPYSTLQYDIWAVSNNPDLGNIKIALDNFAFAGGNNIDNVHADINTDGKGTGENQWHSVSLDLSPYSGTHAFILFVSGDNEVYWDNLRFQA